MKRFVITVAAMALAHSVTAAASVYHGFASGNPDLYSGLSTESRALPMSANTPVTVSALNRYQGIDKGNPDLFNSARHSSTGSQGKPFDVYHGIAEGNTDLE
jgi:hypothetical protein